MSFTRLKKFTGELIIRPAKTHPLIGKMTVHADLGSGEAFFASHLQRPVAAGVEIDSIEGSFKFKKGTLNPVLDGKAKLRLGSASPIPDFELRITGHSSFEENTKNRGNIAGRIRSLQYELDELKISAEAQDLAKSIMKLSGTFLVHEFMDDLDLDNWNPMFHLPFVGAAAAAGACSGGGSC